MDVSRCHHPYHQNRTTLPSPRKSRIVTSPSKKSGANDNGTNVNYLPPANIHYLSSNSRVIPELRPFGTAVARQMYVITRLMQEGYLSFREHSILRSLALGSNSDLRYILPPSLVHAGDDDYLTDQYYSTMVNGSGKGNGSSSSVNGGNTMNSNDRSLSPYRSSSHLSPPGSPSARHERAKQLTYLHQHHLPFDNVYPNNHPNIENFHNQHSVHSSSSVSHGSSHPATDTSKNANTTQKKSLAHRSIATWDPLITLLMERRRDITDLVPSFSAVPSSSTSADTSSFGTSSSASGTVTSSTLNLYHEYYQRLVANKLPYPIPSSTDDPNHSTGPVPPAQALADLILALRHLVEQEAERQFHNIFSYIMDADIKLVSRKERDARGLLTDTSLTYGEIRFSTFATVVRLALQDFHQGLPDTPESRSRLDNGLTFVDLGSGAGKALIAVALLFNMKRIIGIEVLEGLHLISEEAVRRYFAYYSQQYQSDQASIDRSGVTYQQLGIQYRPTIINGISSDGTQSMKNLALPTIDLYRASFLPSSSSSSSASNSSTNSNNNKFPSCPVDWAQEGDILFANSTCFSDTLMMNIAEQIPYMRNGTILISFTRPFEHDHIQILRVQKYTQSWGNATVFIARVQHPDNFIPPSRTVEPPTEEIITKETVTTVNAENASNDSLPPPVYYVPVAPPPRGTTVVNASDDQGTENMTPLTPWTGPLMTTTTTVGTDNVESTTVDKPSIETEPVIPTDSLIGELHSSSSSSSSSSSDSFSSFSPRDSTQTPLHDLLDDDVEYEKQLVHELEDYIDKTTKAYVADMESYDKLRMDGNHGKDDDTTTATTTPTVNDNESTLEYDDTGYSGPVTDTGALLLHIEEQKKLHTPLPTPQKGLASPSSRVAVTVPEETDEERITTNTSTVHKENDDASSISSSRVIRFGSDRWYMVHAARRGELIPPDENLWAPVVVPPVHSIPASKISSPSRSIAQITETVSNGKNRTTTVSLPDASVNSSSIRSPSVVRPSPHTDLSSPQGEMLLNRKYHPRRNIFSPNANNDSPVPSTGESLHGTFPIIPLSRSKSEETAITNGSTTSETFRPIENTTTVSTSSAKAVAQMSNTNNDFFRSSSTDSTLSALTDSPTEDISDNTNTTNNNDDGSSPLPDDNNNNNNNNNIGTNGTKPSSVTQITGLSIGNHMIAPSTLDTPRISVNRSLPSNSTSNINGNLNTHRSNSSTGSTPILSPRSNGTSRSNNNPQPVQASVSRVRAPSSDSYGGGIGEASADLAKILAGYAASQAAQAAALVAALSNHSTYVTNGSTANTNSNDVIEETNAEEETTNTSPYMVRPQSSPTEESIPEELPYIPNSDNDEDDDEYKGIDENTDNSIEPMVNDADRSADDLYPPPIEWTIESVNNTIDSVTGPKKDTLRSTSMKNDNYTINVSTSLEDALHSSHTDLTNTLHTVTVPVHRNVSTLRFSPHDDTTPTKNNDDAEHTGGIDNEAEEVIGYITRSKDGKTVFHTGKPLLSSVTTLPRNEDTVTETGFPSLTTTSSTNDQQQQNQLLQAVIGNGPIISPSHLTHRSMRDDPKIPPSSRVAQATASIEKKKKREEENPSVRGSDMDSPFGEALLSRKARQTKLDDKNDNDHYRPTTATTITDTMISRDLRRAVLSARMRANTNNNSAITTKPSVILPPNVPVTTEPITNTSVSSTSSSSSSTVSSTNTSFNEITKHLQFSSNPSSANSSFLHINQPTKYVTLSTNNNDGTGTSKSIGKGNDDLEALINENDIDSPMDNALYKRKIVSDLVTDMNTSLGKISRTSTRSSSTTDEESPPPHYYDAQNIRTIKQASSLIKEKTQQEFLLGTEIRDSPQGTALVQRKMKAQPLR